MIRVAPLAALLTLVVITAAGAQQWINHRPDDGGYSVAFPAKPRVDLHNVDTRVGLVRTRTSVLEVGDRTFLTIDSIYPSDFTMGDPQDDLDIVRNGGVGKVNGKLLSEVRLSINNAPARRLVIDMPQSGQAADALMVLDGNRLYQAVFVGPRGPKHREEANRFLSSFVLER